MLTAWPLPIAEPSVTYAIDGRSTFRRFASQWGRSSPTTSSFAYG
jgi:hypothetical protein